MTVTFELESMHHLTGVDARGSSNVEIRIDYGLRQDDLRAYYDERLLTEVSC